MCSYGSNNHRAVHGIVILSMNVVLWCVGCVSYYEQTHNMRATHFELYSTLPCSSDVSIAVMEGRIPHAMADVRPVHSTMLYSRVSTIRQYMVTVFCYLLVGLTMNVEDLSRTSSVLLRTLSVIGIARLVMSVTYILHCQSRLPTLGNDHSSSIYANQSCTVGIVIYIICAMLWQSTYIKGKLRYSQLQVVLMSTGQLIHAEPMRSKCGSAV